MEKIQIYEEMDYLKKPYGEEMAAAVAERESQDGIHLQKHLHLSGLVHLKRKEEAKLKV